VPEYLSEISKKGQRRKLEPNITEHDYLSSTN
jgi:hypothetical protein